MQTLINKVPLSQVLHVRRLMMFLLTGERLLIRGLQYCFGVHLGMLAVAAGSVCLHEKP